jgi:membrane fusion protein (multidrug efflux system)
MSGMNEINEIDGPPENRKGKKRRAFMIFGTIVIVGLAAGYFYRGYARAHLKTDDAFVEGAIHIIAPRVSGTVTSIYVTNNQRVHADDILAELDEDIYVQKLAETEAAAHAESQKLFELEAMIEAQKSRVSAARAVLERAKSSRAELAAMVQVREAEIRVRQAAMDQAGIDLKRAENLIAKEVISRDRFERAKTQHDTAQASLDAAVKLHQQAEVTAKAHRSTIHQTRAALAAEDAALVKATQALKTQGEKIKKQNAISEQARLNLSYTRITSPAEGLITRKSVEIGNQLQAGQPIMSVVSMKNAYVLANYKETRLHLIKPGQKVKLKLDAYPGKKFTGKVDSIMAGTGAAFSLLPPENASGNYVKVVQRVPVKIVFDDIKEAEPYLRVGMSVVPTILTKE